LSNISEVRIYSAFATHDATRRRLGPKKKNNRALRRRAIAEQARSVFGWAFDPKACRISIWTDGAYLPRRVTISPVG
jgi:hypothetical protein